MRMPDIDESLTTQFLESYKPRYEKRIKSGSKDPARLERIFNEDLNKIDVKSKRWQLPVNRKTLEGKHELVKSITSKVNHFIRNIGKPDYEIVKTLVLISEPGCKQQAIHKDATEDDQDFIVGILALSDNTEFIVADGNSEEYKKKITLNNRDLLLMDAHKYHAGGANLSNDYNCRLHFRIGNKADKAHNKTTDSVGISTIVCDCGRIFKTKSARKSHQYRYCEKNPNSKTNRDRRNDIRNNKRRKIMRERDSLTTEHQIERDDHSDENK